MEGGGDGVSEMIMCSFQRIVNKWLRQRRGQPAGHAGLETCLIAKPWESEFVGPDASIERAMCDDGRRGDAPTGIPLPGQDPGGKKTACPGAKAGFCLKSMARPGTDARARACVSTKPPKGRG